MFCGKCGKPINDGEVICSECMEKMKDSSESIMKNAASTEQLASETEKEIGTAVQYSQPEAENAGNIDRASEQYDQSAEPSAQNPNGMSSFYASPSPENAEEPKKKKSKKKVVLIVIAALIAVLAALTAIFWPYVSNFVRGIFSSDEDTFKRLAKEDISETVEEYSDNYGDFVELAKKIAVNGYKSEGKSSISVEPSIISLLNNLGVDLSALSDMKFNTSSAYKDGISENEIEIMIGNDKFLTLDLEFDVKNAEINLRIPEWNDKYISVNIPDLIASEDSDGSAEEAFRIISSAVEKLPEFVEVLPDEDTFEKLVNKYCGIVIDGIKNVESESETLKVGDKEVKCTCYTANISEKELDDIAVSVLEEVKKDGDVKDIVLKVIDLVGTITDEDDFDADKEYGDFEKSIDDSIKEIKKEASEIKENKNLITIRTRTDAKGDIVGREVLMADEFSFRYNSVEKDDNTSFEYEVNTSDTVIGCNGEYTDKNDVISGSSVITFGTEGTSNEVLKVDINGTDKDDKVNEKLKISAGKDLAKLLSDAGVDSTVTGIIGHITLNADISSSDDGACKINIGVEILEKEGVKIEIDTGKLGFGGIDIDVPAVSEKFNVSDEDDLESWIKGINISELFKSLKMIGFSEQDLISFFMGAND